MCLACAGVVHEMHIFMSAYIRLLSIQFKVGPVDILRKNMVQKWNYFSNLYAFP